MEILHGSTEIICQTDKMMNKGTYVGVFIIFLKLHAAIKYHLSYSSLLICFDFDFLIPLKCLKSNFVTAGNFKCLYIACSMFF